MDNKFIIIEIIEAICEVARAKKEAEITIQDLDYANRLFNDISTDRENTINLLEELVVEMKSFSNKEQEKVLSCITKIFMANLDFDNECLRIINMRK